MGMNLVIGGQTFDPAEDQTWLGSRHGTQECDPVTIDGSLVTNALWPNGLFKSGAVLAKVTATGLYAPYLAGAGNGQEVALGHLFTTLDLSAGGKLVVATAKMPAALYWHGEVITANLPTNHALSATANLRPAFIKYV